MASAPDRQPLRLRTKILLGLTALAMLVGLAELVVNLVAPSRLLDLEALEAQAQQHAATLQADPVLGHAPVLDGPSYDRFGLLRRWGPRGSVVTKREGAVRLLLLGDSAVPEAGLAAPLRELWHRIVAEPAAAEFLDGAVEGWNPMQQVEFYFRHQRQLAPDHVVVVLHNDDLTETTVACIHEERLTLCNPGALVPIDASWYRSSALYRHFVHSRYTDRRSFRYCTYRAIEVSQALQRLRDEIDERGARLTVLVMPIYGPESGWEVYERVTRDLSLAILQALEITAVDLQPAWQEAAAAGIVLDRAGAGYLVARAAADALFGSPPLPCTAAPRVVTAGQAQLVRFAAGDEFAGRRFLVLGSMRGIMPATDLPRGRVTLAEDDYLKRTSDRSAPPLSGELDGAGNGEITVPVPDGAEPGSILWHQAVVADRRGIHYERIGWPMPMFVRAR